MSNERLLLAAADHTLIESLRASLHGRGIESLVTSFQPTAAVEDVSACGLIVMPGLASSQSERWAAIADELTATFALVQRYTLNAPDTRKCRHVIALLPAKAAMGDPADTGMSALTGAMISLFRTLTLEYRKLGMTANTIFYERLEDGGVLGCDAIASLVDTFIAQHAPVITGQEVYACAGSDTGRLHP